MLMLVEDEELVRDLVQGLLTRAGYEVVAVASAEDALQLAPSVAERLELVVTDIVLPQMDGLQMTQQLRASMPRLRIIHMSGNPADQRRAADPLTMFLRKPFSRADLLDAVRRLLASPA